MATDKTEWYKENHISHRGVRWGSITRVEDWAKERGLIDKEPVTTHNTDGEEVIHLPIPDKQMLKLLEEVGETARAVLYHDFDEIRDGIGDCVVCLIVLAAQCGMTLEECMDEAWDEIKDRTGKLEDGLFKKDGDFEC